MIPAFEPGDVVLLDSSPHADPFVVAGDVVVARHPFQRDTQILKRVEHLTKDGGLFLMGDDPEESTDSRSFGSIDPSAVLGVVVTNLGQ
jgi:nickel-type superoxide dismutase maturation protease